MQQPENIDAKADDSGAPDVGTAQFPILSIILPADHPDTLRGVLEQLRRQTLASQLEIVVATPCPSAFGSLQVDPAGFHSANIVVADLSSLGQARALALRAARAPCVFLGETHSFAGAPNWAEHLVARHREGWAVVVPGFHNANPRRMLSWAGFLLDYGGWMHDQPAGER